MDMFVVQTAIIVVLAALAMTIVWTCLRAVYFWIAAKVHGWTPEEKFNRQIAGTIRREERRAQRQAYAASNIERRRLGVSLTAIAITGLAVSMGALWWQAALAGLLIYTGLSMAAGLAFRW